MDYSITLHAFTEARFLETRALHNVHEYHTLLTHRIWFKTSKCFKKTLNGSTDYFSIMLIVTGASS